MRSSTAVLVRGFTIIPSPNSKIEAGIRIYPDSNDCTVTDNLIQDFVRAITGSGNMHYGLLLYGRTCNITGNIFLNDGLFVYNPYGNVVENNFVNGKPLLYLESISDYTVDDAGQVILVNCNGIRVENLNLSSTTVGVELWETNNAKLIGNNITNNNFGSYLYMSSGNIISRNNITNNEYGSYLGMSSGNIISRNNIAGNTYYGIYSYGYDSDDNHTICRNNITNNSYGIFSYRYDGDGNNIIYQNNIAGNYYGVYCQHSNGNGNNIEMAYGNSITNNNYGVYFYEYGGGQASINNEFHHNNFIDNTINQAYPHEHPQVWDAGSEHGHGNHWSDYAGSDLDGDGIGDTTHVIDANNQDNYPLMNPWTPVLGDTDGNCRVNLDDLFNVLMGYCMTIEDAMSTYGVPPGTDMDGDGHIDLDDLYEVLWNYGT